MKKITLFIFLGLGLSLTSACSVSTDVGGRKVAEVDVGGGGDHQSYKYDYTCNGCPTKEQVFSSKEDYCSGLLNEGRNNSCCRYLREQTYEKDCR